MSESFEELNKRTLQAVAYLIEWAKHIITISAALLVLSATIVKDLAKDARAPVSYWLAGFLVCFCLSTLGAVLCALQLVRKSASVVLTTAPQIGDGKSLQALQDHLDRTQMTLLSALGFFAVVVLLVVFTWTFGHSQPQAADPALTSSPNSTPSTTLVVRPSSAPPIASPSAIPTPSN